MVRISGAARAARVNELAGWNESMTYSMTGIPDGLRHSARILATRRGVAAKAFFRIPGGRMIELGTQVEI